MDEPVVCKTKVANLNGIHARPSYAIVSAALGFEATIELHCDGRVADARSILSVMTLGAAHGAAVEVFATGPQAQEAALRIVELLASEQG